MDWLEENEPEIDPETDLNRKTFVFNKACFLKFNASFMKKLAEWYDDGPKLLQDLEAAHKICYGDITDLAESVFLEQVLKKEAPHYKKKLGPVPVRWKMLPMAGGAQKMKDYKEKQEKLLEDYSHLNRIVNLKPSPHTPPFNDIVSPSKMGYRLPPGEKQGKWDPDNKDFLRYWTVPAKIGGLCLTKYEDCDLDDINFWEVFKHTGYPYYRRAAFASLSMGENCLFCEALEDDLKTAIQEGDVLKFFDKFLHLHQEMIRMGSKFEINIKMKLRRSLSRHYGKLTDDEGNLSAPPPQLGRGPSAPKPQQEVSSSNVNTKSFSGRYDSMESKSSPLDAISEALCDDLDQLINYAKNQDDIIAEQNDQIDYLTKQLTLNQRGSRGRRRHRYSRDEYYY